jgi:uncharacterized protein YbaP (TraB family)
LAVALVVVAGCATRRTPAPPGAAEPKPGPLVWRVESAGRTSHLFGTIHLGIDLDRALGPRGTAALDAATTVFVEMDLSNPNRARALGAEAARSGVLPIGQSLRQMLGPEMWARLCQVLPNTNPASLDHLEPWLAALSALQAIAAKSGATPQATAKGPARIPMDVVIVQRARQRGAAVVELDSMQQQLAAFMKLPRTEALAMLRELLRNPDAAGGQLRSIVAAYDSDDAERRLTRLVDDMQAQTPAFAEHLLFRRTERWAEQLDLPLRAGGAFVAVGAGHLVGPRGLPALLARRGFRVERLAPAAAREAWRQRDAAASAAAPTAPQYWPAASRRGVAPNRVAMSTTTSTSAGFPASVEPQ